MEILKRDMREPIVSGLFYPEDGDALSQKVTELLKSAGTVERGSLPRAILSPHGSWEQCGASIASAFSAIGKGRPDRILLMGPVHRETSGQQISYPSKKYFSTPLGLVPVDQKICRALTAGSDLFISDDSPHMEEHALELQLPFIRSLFPETPLIPLLTADLKRSAVKKAAAVIRKEVLTAEGETLIILTANLSRYAPLSEGEAEADAILKLLDMPLESSILDLKKRKKISSCGSVLLTLLSDLGLFTKERRGTFSLLNREKTVVNENRGTMAVHYGGGFWL